MGKITRSLLLIAFVLIGLIMIIHIIVVIKKPKVSKIKHFIIAAGCIVVSAILIPAVSASFSIPWKTIRLFAPDIAWIIIAFVALYLVFGIVLGAIVLRKKVSNKNLL